MTIRTYNYHLEIALLFFNYPGKGIAGKMGR